ncbi:hypothetical protein SAMN05661096_00958 [Marivirga sericea]|uniref:Uncharacterized protein n=1 Tax=Marivirga sericea TaxID=1028 RepID=A0A1X7IQZ3_9BACT|nr:hypothetical protein [Marivirga sericea]SMG17475.1 hypothetical protein SAMN05661096_00958 [Marivirga sericea]
MKFKFILPLILILNGFSVYGQISQPLRYEIEIDNFNDEYYIISAKEDGLFLFKEMDEKTENNESIWEIIRLDTSLQVINKSEVIIDKRFSLKGYSYDNEKFVMLFQEGYEYAEDMLFLTFSVNSDTFKSYVYENVVPINLTEFEVKNDAVVFGGNVNMRTVVMMYNFTAKRGVVLPGFYNDRSKLLQIVTKTEDDWVRIITSDRLPDKRYGITVRAFSTMGESIFTESLEANEGLSLTDGRVINSSEGGNLLAGTYSIKRRTETSRGIYVADIERQSQDKIRYYNYANLENFFNYMREGRKNRVMKRIARKKVKGKRLKFSYRLFVQDIVKQGDQNILIGEAYFPTYTNRTSGYGYSSYTYDAVFNNMSTQRFDGYKYTHAVIIAFDDDGKLLWDNSFEINDLKSFQLEEHVHLAFLENEIVMLYLFNQELKIKVIKGREIIEGKFTESLKLMHESDEMKSNNEELEGLKQWYGNNFYAFGVNRVKNLKDENIKLNRKVFFINKIVVE